MHTITRRSAPALIAALAGAFATPLAAMPAADPVFTALEAFARADAAWEIAQAREDDIFASDHDMSRGPRVKIGMWTDLVRESPDYNQERPYYLFDEDAILRHTAGPSSKLRDRLLAEFREDVARQGERQRESGYTEAVRLCNEAFQHRCDCESALLRTVPASLAGAIALAEFAQKAAKNGYSDCDEGAFEATMLEYLHRQRAAGV